MAWDAGLWAWDVCVSLLLAISAHHPRRRRSFSRKQAPSSTAARSCMSATRRLTRSSLVGDTLPCVRLHRQRMRPPSRSSAGWRRSYTLWCRSGPPRACSNQRAIHRDIENTCTSPHQYQYHRITRSVSLQNRSAAALRFCPVVASSGPGDVYLYRGWRARFSAGVASLSGQKTPSFGGLTSGPMPPPLDVGGAAGAGG
jgi:hypothetical protein